MKVTAIKPFHFRKLIMPSQNCLDKHRVKHWKDLKDNEDWQILKFQKLQVLDWNLFNHFKCTRFHDIFFLPPQLPPSPGTCNEQRLHPGGGLGRFEELGQVLLREGRFPSALALHVLLLAPLLVLKFREKRLWLFFSTRGEKRPLTRVLNSTPGCINSSSWSLLLLRG